MLSRRFLLLVLVLILACTTTRQVLPANVSTAGSASVGALTAECQRLIDAGNYTRAKRAALKLTESPLWMNGNLEAAGAIRAVADAFRAAGRVDLGEQVLSRAAKTHRAKGDAALALRGLTLPESTRRTLPVIDRVWRIPLAVNSRSLNTPPVFNPARDLRRLRVGNQASVLKVMDPANRTVAFMRGLDGVMWAPVLETHRQGIFAAMGIQAASLDRVARDLISGYPKTRQKKECIALLGIIGSSTGPALTDATRKEIQTFLVTVMRGSKDVVLRRQACLNLALQGTILPGTLDAVTLFYEKSKNLWETFPVQQVFEYQKSSISLLPNREQIRSRIAAVKGLYTPHILKLL